jgi:hypothetical protein
MSVYLMFDLPGSEKKLNLRPFSQDKLLKRRFLGHLDNFFQKKRKGEIRPILIHFEAE